MRLEDALGAYRNIILEFSSREFDTKDLLDFLAPGVPQMPSGPAPQDVAFWFESDKAVTVRTRDPALGVLWWPKTPADEPVNDLHINPYSPVVPYDQLIAYLGLGDMLALNQSHPLADIQRTHVFHGIKIVISQIVYSDLPEAQGLVGGLSLHRIFS